MIIGVHNQDLVFRNVKSRDYLLGSRETAIDNNCLFLFLRHFFLEGTPFCAIWLHLIMQSDFVLWLFS